MSWWGWLFGKSSESEGLEPFDLDTPLVNLGGKGLDPWTLRDACEGVSIFGATGSGKSSGSGQLFAKTFIQAGYGGLVLTVKNDERQTWERYCAECGCSDNLIVVSPESGAKINILDYELNRPGAGAGITENLVTLFYSLVEVADKHSGGGKSSGFWERAVKQILRNAIELLNLARGKISIRDIYDLINSAPISIEEIQNKTWQENSFLLEMLNTAEEKVLTPRQQQDLLITGQYWLSEYPTLAEKTRSIIVSSFTAIADTFLRGHLAEMFTTTTNIVPELSHEGAIILLDMPIKEWGAIGLYGQMIIKYIWQKAVERRNIKKNNRPVFLWIDEAQYFISKYDMLYATTSRSNRGITVMLTQNINNYYSMLAADGNGRSLTESFLGNLNTKIFHSNGDTATNQYAADLIGKDEKFKTTHSKSVNYKRDSIFSSGHKSKNTSISSEYD